MRPPAEIIADGSLHRFPSDGKPGDDAGWYVLHSEPIPAGAYGCWRRGLTSSWRADMEMTAAQQAEFADKVLAMRAAYKAEREAVHREARIKAGKIWRATNPAVKHQYLKKKGILAHGARLHGASLAIPQRIGTDLHSLQFISPHGEKIFLTGGRTSGCYFSIRGEGPLCIVEGFATGASVSEATGYSVAVAFSAGNLRHVAREIMSRVGGEIIICADNDAPGRMEAREAALAIGAAIVMPPEEGMDFNDLAIAKGLGAVAEIIGG